MTWLKCPYLTKDVELTDERRTHIETNHPELLPEHEERLWLTISDPNEIRIDEDYPRTRLFVRWFDDLYGGKLLIAVVVTDPPPAERHWIVTAFVAGRPARGETEWKRP
jgi:hypothetical protein